ncbi:MAG: lamin tail domain-containing protein, partial [Mariniphaga sp.]|nr:lamin tail domain-containing protein [Mariniphaga sp.]
AYETGSGANESTKYLQAYFKINNSEKILLENNGRNLGNWGSTIVKQTGLSGDSLQIVVLMANHYSSDKVTLDEIVVTGETGDNLPPFITDIKVKSSDSLAVYFNEPINTEDLRSENFSLFSKDGKIPITFISELFHNYLYLKIQTARLPDLFLAINDISDLSGNITITDTFSFNYFPPVSFHDIVINEIMADPYPPQELPEYEFIELYNHAKFPIQLEGWSLVVDETEKKLNKFILLPKEFVVLSPTAAFDSLSKFGNVLPVKSFPSLRNSGASISIISKNGLHIDEISYSENWKLKEEKKNGGWSMERIDPNRFCGQSANWQFAKNNLGGTPGNENTVRQDNPDNEPPWLTNLEALSPTSLSINFSELMDTLRLKNINNFYISDDFGHPKSIKLISLENVVLNFSNSFSEDKFYTLEVLNLIDECGNNLANNSFDFSWSVARQGDIVINEVLSNPYPEGTDFVEVYNNSKKHLNLDHLWFSNGKDTIKLIHYLEHEIILEPEKYLVCTKDSAKVVDLYFSSSPQNIIEISDFPTIYNNDGTLILMNGDFEEIDRFSYFEEMHSPILAEFSGVSLERISFDSQTNDPANWHSAAENCGYATPGYNNSQASLNLSTSVKFEPESFSPNLDGYNDEYRINYQLNKPGYVANCWIFDVSGNLILQLVKNEILATNGNLSWNGKDETGQKMPLGVYVVLLEIFDLNGNLNRYKDAVVLTDFLD